MIRADFSNLRKLANEIGARSGDLRPALEPMADALKTAQRDHFRQGGLEGRPWIPLADRSGKKPLAGTGKLSHSIGVDVSDDRITLYSDLPYARVHQFGSKRIPARPFLAVKDESVLKAIRKVIAHLMKGER